MNRVLHGKIESFARHYRGEKFHALLCDPPYELNFMGRNWDKTGIAFNPETWVMLAEHLYDGAFGMAFASSRGWHRLAVAIEDAGLVIHPSIFGWAFGSGFPKATRIDTQIDRKVGAERKIVGEIKRGSVEEAKARGASYLADPANRNNEACFGYGTEVVTEPATDLAKAWIGHRYGLQALKPALEPIIVFQKPYSGKPVECITQTGAGALWIDGTRIGSESHVIHGKESGHFQPTGGDTIKDYHAVNGRWAANLVLSHSPSCNGSCADDCAVKALGEQSGSTGNGHWSYKPAKDGGIYRYGLKDMPDGGRDDSKGTAARFFFNANWQYEVAEQLANADPVRYQAKASRSERDAGLDEFPEREYSPDTLSAGIERKNGKRDEGSKSKTPFRNVHPTVKPIALARWLATLLLPPAAYAPRRILVPFAGVGSEMIGASLAGWDIVVGIEQDAEYCEIGGARLRYWTEQPALVI